MKYNSFFNELNETLKLGVPDTFTGLGAIITNGSLDGIPLSNLLDHSSDLSKYKNEKQIINFLIEISNIDDPRHDGFHVISQTIELNLISQYFSPPIPSNFDNLEYGVGARFRTAQYGSLCENVLAIVIVSQMGEISIAQKGNVKTLNL